MRVHRLPKVGLRNQLGRALLSLKKRPYTSNYLEYQTKTPLTLPFPGEWYVYWGGRTIRQNYHACTRDQRFAYDFLILKGRRSCTGRGNRIEEFYCFSESIFAPAEGKVVSAVTGQPDCNPGVMTRENPLGNHVILDHENGEFSFLAHLKQGSVAVSVGDRVSAGEKIGECGNSGHSSEPHLHYHLQNTSIPFRGEGLPALFKNYWANGKAVSCGEPSAGQVVRNAS